MLKSDLEQQIRESYLLIREHEGIIQTSDRPEEKLHSRRKIDEQKKLIKEFLAQYIPVCKQLGVDIPQDVKEIAIVSGYASEIIGSPRVPSTPSSPVTDSRSAQNTVPSLFLSYARLDGQQVEAIYQMLSAQGYKPWMDVHDILGGEDWNRAINVAIDRCELFLPILSNNSVSRRGMILKEVRRALDKWNEMLPDDIYMIPLRLDDCPIPELVQNLQVIDWADGKGEASLLHVIDVALKRRQQ